MFLLFFALLSARYFSALYFFISFILERRLISFSDLWKKVFFFIFLSSVISAIYYLFILGSKASLSPSPTKLKANTVRRMKIPGEIHIQGQLRITTLSLTELTMLPQLAYGTPTPIPRKLIVDSMRITPPRSI